MRVRQIVNKAASTCAQCARVLLAYSSSRVAEAPDAGDPRPLIGHGLGHFYFLIDSDFLDFECVQAQYFLYFSQFCVDIEIF